MNEAKLEQAVSNGTVSISFTSYLYRLGALLLFLGPIAYIASLACVAIHEILGHGLAALCLAGQFEGFMLKWDGMGYAIACAHPNSPNYHVIIVLLAGVVATTFFGLVFMILALLNKKRLFTHMAFLLLATNCLLDGPSYIFWNAYHPAPPGDIARVLALLEISSLRWILTSAGAAFMIVAIIVMNALIFRAIEQWLGPGKQLHGIRRLIPLAILFIGQAIAWFAFDWNQIAEGIGQLPNITGTVLTLAALTGLYFFSLKVPAYKGQISKAVLPIIIAWSLTISVLLIIYFWLANGVTWA